MRVRTGRVSPLIVLVSMAVVVVVAVGSGSAATTTKPYTATFAPVPPATVAGGSVATITLTLANLASPQTLGSANVTAQPAFTIADATVQGAGDIDGTTFPTTLLKLRDLNIAPNTSRTITMNVTTPCSASADDEWEITAKQSNNFSGPPGNDFSLQPDGSNLHTAVGGGSGTPASLEFTQQPTDTAKQTAIAPAVQVEVVDSCGSTTNATGMVTLALVPAEDTMFGGGGGLGGTTPTDVSDGAFTFGNLSVSESGIGYKLTASYPGVDDLESTGFDVYDALCPPTCTASNATGTQIGVQGFSGSAGLSVGPNVSTAECGSGLTPLGSTFAIVPLSGTTGTYTAVLTIPKPALQGVGVSNIVVCVSETPDGPLQRLSQCAKKNPRPKCIVSKTSSNAGDAVIAMLFDGDPYGGGFS